MSRASEKPPASILKPLHGDEPGLYENLRSCAEQDYPAVQMVMGVRNRADAALGAARALIADLPDRDIEIVVDPRVRGSNLKVANLENMLSATRYDTLILSDSDMRVGPGYVGAVTAPLTDEGVGAVTCLYKGVSTGGLWSTLGALHINFGFLPSALVADALGSGGGCFGATIALRRNTLDRFGGLGRLRDELADDHRIGAAVRELGLRTELSSYLVENQVTEPSFPSLWRHELRWARTIRAMAPAGYAAAFVTHGVMIAALAALFTGLSLTSCAFVAISCLLRWAAAGGIALTLGLPTTGFWLLPLRDALSFAVFIGSFMGRSVQWRDQLFRVESNGRMTADGDNSL